MQLRLDASNAIQVTIQRQEKRPYTYFVDVVVVVEEEYEDCAYTGRHAKSLISSN